MRNLTIEFLGPAKIMLDGAIVSDIKTAKTTALLAYLALESNRPHRREALAGLLWPDSPENAARSSLRQAVANLRRSLDDAGADPPIFLSSRESLQFNPDAQFAFDVQDFTANYAFTQAHRHRRLDTCPICAGHLQEASQLYKGDFLAGLSLADAPQFESWMVYRRESLHRQALQAMSVLATAALRRADYDAALHLARRQLALEPWRETAARQAMRALAYNGQRGAALALFEQTRQTVAAELGVEPEAETTELYYRIRDDVLGPAPADRRFSGTILPAPTPFIGRETELEELRKRIADPTSRLITLAGPGGSGKTRLARELALLMEADFPHGAAFVPLSAAVDAADIAAAITDVVELRLQSAVSEEEQLLSFLAAKEMLLVLDNYEQLLPELGFLRKLLQQAPGVVILVTSRHRLGLPAEWLYDVRGLHVPAGAPDSALASYSSIQLFAERARQVDHTFRLAPENAEAVAFICRLAGGLPLAIELAAALVRYQTPRKIAGQLQESLEMLASTHADMDPRHRSMKAAFEHSWRLLSESEQRTLSRLSVFRGGFTPELAVEVTGATPQELNQLIDKSLVARVSDGRFELHELFRQFAGAKLADSEGEFTTHERHLHALNDLAQQGEAALQSSPEQIEWLNRLESEHANMRGAIDWGMDHDLQTAASLAAANWLYYFFRGHFNEARRTYDALLEQRDQLPDDSVAWVLNARCSVALAQSDLDVLMTSAGQALDYFQGLQNDLGIGLSYHHLANAVLQRGDFDRTVQLIELGLEAAGSNRWLRAILLQHLVNVYDMRGNLDGAAQTLETLLENSVQINDAISSLYWRLNLAEIEIRRKNLGRAAELSLGVKAEVATFREMQIAAWTEELLGLIALASGEPQKAAAHFQLDIELLDESGSGQNKARILMMLGIAQTESGRMTRAREALLAGSQSALNGRLALDEIGLLEHLTRLDWLERRDPACLRSLSAASTRRREIGVPIQYPLERFINEVIEQIRGEIGEEQFERLWQEGRDADAARLLEDRSRSSA
jgi:predicted ATPase/DNA-binding SARP family transcriptional activator